MSEGDYKPVFIAETQQQRWIKYGANVALSSIVVILLVIALTYLAQTHDHRFDTARF